MADKQEWVVWNGSLGVLDTVTIGRIEAGEDGGPERLSGAALRCRRAVQSRRTRSEGRIVFGACLVMSRQRSQMDQVELRREAQEKRRAALVRREFDGEDLRETLDLPLKGVLKPSEINAAFRRLAKTAHPDAGGSNEAYRRIAEARDVLLEHFASAS